MSFPILPSLIALSILGIGLGFHNKHNKTIHKSKGNKKVKKNNISLDDISFIQREQNLPSLPLHRQDWRNAKRIIVSLTTSPDRLKFVSWVLKTLDLNHVDEIHLNIPLYFQNKKGDDAFKYKTNELDALTREYPSLKVFFQETDLGPIMKLLPTLIRLDLEEKSRNDFEKKDKKETIVITIDDDMAHSKYLIKNWERKRNVKIAEKYPKIGLNPFVF
jgi:hypothetical protein